MEGCDSDGEEYIQGLENIVTGEQQQLPIPVLEESLPDFWQEDALRIGETGQLEPGPHSYGPLTQEMSPRGSNIKRRVKAFYRNSRLRRDPSNLPEPQSCSLATQAFSHDGTDGSDEAWNPDTELQKGQTTCCTLACIVRFS